MDLYEVPLLGKRTQCWDIFTPFFSTNMMSRNSVNYSSFLLGHLDTWRWDRNTLQWLGGREKKSVLCNIPKKQRPLVQLNLNHTDWQTRSVNSTANIFWTICNNETSKVWSGCKTYQFWHVSMPLFNYHKNSDLYGYKCTGNKMCFSVFSIKLHPKLFLSSNIFSESL
jgi:hypothetical protein